MGKMVEPNRSHYTMAGGYIYHLRNYNGENKMISIEDPAFREKEPTCSKKPYGEKSAALFAIKKSGRGGEPYWCTECQVYHVKRKGK